jgi:hypothetical protein
MGNSHFSSGQTWEGRGPEPALSGGHYPSWLAWVASLLLLAGCSSKPAAPAAPLAQAPPPVVAAPAKAAPADGLLPPGAAKPPTPFAGDGWESLFDGKSLAGWRETPFAGHGEAQCLQGTLLLNLGDPFTGVSFTNPLPKMNYEVALDAMRVSGSDFFCGLTVPVGEDFCSLIVGGWGGGLVGISSLDGLDASENPTTKFLNFDRGRWYRIRLRVTQGRIEGWIDEEKVVDVVTTGKKISLRPGDIELSKPFGVASWQTVSAFREIRLRRVNTPADPVTTPHVSEGGPKRVGTPPRRSISSFSAMVAILQKMSPPSALSIDGIGSNGDRFQPELLWRGK